MFDLLPAPVNGLLSRLRHSLASSGASMAGQTAFFPQGRSLLALEPRFFFDAAGLVTADALLPPDTILPLSRVESNPTVLVFVDSSVQDYETLTRDLPANAQLILLSPGEDGIARISDILATREGVEAIHLIGHGSAGSMDVAGTELNLATLDARSEEIRAWGHSLTATADILLYGCDVGAGEAGAALTSRLAALTGADVATSDDLTGSADLSGDWDLEINAGQVEERVIFSLASRTAWHGILVVIGTGDEYTDADSSYNDAWYVNTNTLGAIQWWDATYGDAAGAVNSINDVDWIAVNLTAGTTYEIGVEGEPSGNGYTLADPVLEGIYDANGDFVGGTYADDTFGREPEIFFTPGSTGTYYIAVKGFSENTGSYLAYVEASIPLSFSGNTATSTGNTIDQTNGPSELYFTVYLTAGEGYRVDVTGYDSYSTDPILWGIWSGPTEQIPGSYVEDIAGPPASYDPTFEFIAPQSGYYWIEVGAATGVDGDFDITVTNDSGITWDDFSNETRTDPTAPPYDLTWDPNAQAGFVNGNIGQAYDIDWIKVEMLPGSTYMVFVEGSNWNGMGRNLDDPVIEGIYDYQGNLINGTYNDDAMRLNPLVIFNPSPSEVDAYYIAVRTWGSATGTYTLFLTTSTDLGVDTVGDGKITYSGQRQWWAVDVNADTTYRVFVDGTPYNNAGELLDPYLHGVFRLGWGDWSGMVPGTRVDDAIGSNPVAFFTPNLTGRYYILTGGYGSNTGTYTIEVQTEPYNNFDLRDDTYTQGWVFLNEGVTGLIDGNNNYGDRDWYGVSLSANYLYQITVEGYYDPWGNYSRWGSLSDSMVNIYDAYGNWLASNDDWYSRSSLLEFVPDWSGIFYIEVLSYYPGDVGTFLLNVQEIRYEYDDVWDDYYEEVYYDDFYDDDAWMLWDLMFWDENYYGEETFWGDDFWGGEDGFWGGDGFFGGDFGLWGGDFGYFDPTSFMNPGYFFGEGDGYGTNQDGQQLGPDGQPLEEGEQRGDGEEDIQGEGEGEGEGEQNPEDENNPEQNAQDDQGEELQIDRRLLQQLRQLGGARNMEIQDILRSVGNLVNCGR